MQGLGISRPCVSSQLDAHCMTRSTSDLPGARCCFGTLGAEVLILLDNLMVQGLLPLSFSACFWEYT